MLQCARDLTLLSLFFYVCSSIAVACSLATKYAKTRMKEEDEEWLASANANNFLFSSGKTFWRMREQKKTCQTDEGGESRMREGMDGRTWLPNASAACEECQEARLKYTSAVSNYIPASSLPLLCSPLNVTAPGRQFSFSLTLHPAELRLLFPTPIFCPRFTQNHKKLRKMGPRTHFVMRQFPFLYLLQGDSSALRPGLG